jgi:hypothetical protein
MSPFRTATFWLLLPPSAIAFALPGVIIGEGAAFERWAHVILPLQAFVTIAVPYVLVRRWLAGRSKEVRGFHVVQSARPERESKDGEPVASD